MRGLEHDHTQRRLATPQRQRRPEPGVPAADDADVRLGVARERRRLRIGRGLVQPPRHAGQHRDSIAHMAERAFWNPMTNLGAFREKRDHDRPRRGLDRLGRRGQRAARRLRARSGTATSATAARSSPTPPRSRWPSSPRTRPTTGSRRRRPRRSPTRVTELVPLEGAKIFFTSGGGESIDTAAKLARAYWAAIGKPDKHVIISRQFAYHGSNAYGTSLGGMAALTDVYGRLVSDVEQVPVGRRRGARRGDRPDRRRQRGRVLRRADHRRRRRDDPARRLPRPRAGDLPRARGAARPRRGDHRVRPHRRVVRDRALRPLARPDHRREGHHVGVHPARRRDRLVARRRAVLGRGHARTSSATASRTPGTRPPARSGWRTST